MLCLGPVKINQPVRKWVLDQKDKKVGSFDNVFLSNYWVEGEVTRKSGPLIIMVQFISCDNQPSKLWQYI